MNQLKAYEKASYSLVAKPKPCGFTLQFYFHLGIELPVENKEDKLSGIFMGTELTVNRIATYGSNTDFIDMFSYSSFDKFQENYLKQNNKSDSILVFNQSLITNQNDLMAHFALVKKDFITKLRPQVQDHDQLVLKAIDINDSYTCTINFTWLRKHIKEFELKIPKLIVKKLSFMTYEEIMAIKREQYLNRELSSVGNKPVNKI